MKNLKTNKQYGFKLPFITYWGSGNYHWVKVFKYTRRSIIGNRVNSYELFTILYNNGKITIE